MRLTERRERSARTIAREFDRRYELSEQSAQFADHTYKPSDRWPTLQVDDASGIPFLKGIVGIEFYQLRAFVRARQGDLVAATCEGSEAYQRYNDVTLGLGRAEFVAADSVDAPIRVAHACRYGRTKERLVAWAKEAGGAVIHPYMGIEDVWLLAADLAEAAAVPVKVLGPPPAVCWFANDKEFLTELASSVVGTGSVVATRMGTSVDALMDAVRELAAQHPEVALKLTRSASAMGNEVFDSATLNRLSAPELQVVVEGYLQAKDWLPGEHVLAVSWEDAVSSPSAQTWIPPLGAGQPRLDGIYEQLLEGPEKVFLGSLVSTLPPHVEEKIGRWALEMATAYQELGYVGCCSFDFIEIGDGDVRFVECNGRWGGTSNPMHLIDRVFRDGRPPYRAQDVVSPALVGASFEDLTAMLGEHLYDAKTGRGRYIVYNVGGLEAHGKFDVIVLGDTVEHATEGLEEQLPLLIAS